MSAVLDLRNLCRDYPTGRKTMRRALDDVSFAIEPGTIFALLGESGSGKSTLARIVMALDVPTSGQVLFEGDDLASLGARALARRRRDFQMVFQDPYGSLDPHQTIGRIVAEPLHLVADAPRGPARRALVGRMLDDVGLDPGAADRYPHEFSGGQRQRIAIARALVSRPKLVVADEAVSALDVSIQAQILRLLLDLRDRHGLSILFITHNIGVADEVADRIGIMQAGRLVESGTKREVLDHPAHPHTRRLIDSEPTLDRIGRRGRRTLFAAEPG